MADNVTTRDRAGAARIFKTTNTSEVHTPHHNAQATPVAVQTNALSKLRMQAAASTNATSVKASAGRLYGIHLFNAAASIKYLKFYNKASAPTVGSDTPTATYPIEAGKRLDLEFIYGIPFATGIALAITGALADADTTALVALDVVGEFTYA